MMDQKSKGFHTWIFHFSYSPSAKPMIRLYLNYNRVVLNFFGSVAIRGGRAEIWLPMMSTCHSDAISLDLLFRHSLVCHSNWPRCVLPSHGTPTVLAWFCFPQLPVYFICAWAIPILPNTLLQCLEGCCDDALPCHHFGAKNRLICIC